MVKLAMDTLFEAQARCAERCYMAGLNDPDQIQRAFDWFSAPSGPCLDAEGDNVSGVSMTYQDAMLRCANQVLRGACETPVEIA